MKVFQFPIAKITFFFVLGILLGYWFFPNILFVFLILFFLLVGIFVSFSRKRDLFYTISIYFFSFFLGISAQSIHDVRNNKQHYSKFIASNGEPQIAEVCVVEKLKSNQYADRYFVKAIKIGSKSCVGKILMNVYRDSSKTEVDIGDNLLFASKLIAHKPPNNPNQFDYGQYLARKSVFAQVYVSKNQMQISDNKTKNIWYYTSIFRKKIINNLRKHHFREQELQVINALILGQQQEIDADILQDYQYAGAIHVLSVSGLHVGYILLFLNFILGFLPKNKFFNIIVFCIILFSLWIFAFIAGLSPSVVRSATMFTFLAAGQCLGRETNIFHTLLGSLFFILLVEPSFVFDVGFQLSYVSLFFILWLHPLLKSMWLPGNIIIVYFWDIVTVSVAAQLGAFPLSVYYFHQFPGLFFVTNLVILPTLGLIMALGVIVLAFAFFDYVPSFLAVILEKAIYYLNSIIGKIAHFENFIIKDISLDLAMLVGLYLFIIAAVLCWQKFNFTRIVFVLAAVVTLQCTFFYNKQHVESKQLLLVLHQAKKTVILKQIGNKASVYSNDVFLNEIEKNRVINSYLVANFLKMDKKVILSNTLYYKTKKILVVDSSFIISKKINHDLMIITQSPKLNFDRLLDVCHPKIVVADGSNYKSYCRIWSASCRKRNIPFHATAEKGYYKIID